MEGIDVSQPAFLATVLSHSPTRSLFLSRRFQHRIDNSSSKVSIVPLVHKIREEIGRILLFPLNEVNDVFN